MGDNTVRILHLCLSNFYIDGYNYQENVLPKISHELGHDVKIIASTETFLDNKTLGYLEPGRYITEYGVEIIRLPYRKILCDKITCKIRIYKNLYGEIERFKPDLIFSHDVSYCSINEVVKYVKKHKNVCFLTDTHAAFYNSGLNWISRNILHRIIYGYVIRRAMPYIKKYYYIGFSEKEFSVKMYRIPECKMDFLPLGGIIPKQEEKQQNYFKYRKIFHIKNNELLLVHSGKITKEKETISLMRAFTASENLKAKLVIIGSVVDDLLPEFNRCLKHDDRIIYVGWKDKDYLLGCLCACDLYCQPGSPSVTLQNAICCGAAVMAKSKKIYGTLNVGNFLWAKDENDIFDTFTAISEGTVNIEILKERSMICALKYLDYYMLERKIRNQAEKVV